MTDRLGSVSACEPTLKHKQNGGCEDDGNTFHSHFFLGG
jgi:hypothetical protein